jgi:hypothetical protein
MKLILCEKCSDIVALRLNLGISRCFCGESGGRYVDELNAEVWGPCFKLGFANSSLIAALRAQKFEGDSKETMIYGYKRVTKGRDFQAFIIPESADTMKRIDKPDV